MNLTLSLSLSSDSVNANACLEHVLARNKLGSGTVAVRQNVVSLCL